jgi:predicted membrane chloride channel (bestrophin family)
MKQYSVVLNSRTVVVVLISVIVTFLAFELNINFRVDLTLISIAVIFPLVFTIRGSFRRREKALEHLSQFRSSLKTISYFFSSTPKLTDELKAEIAAILLKISDTTVEHLKKDDHATAYLDDTVDEVYKFLTRNQESISGGFRDRIFRLLETLHEAIENLHAIHIHRTPISLKAYCKVFIYLFPFIYAPSLISTIGADSKQWVTYGVVLATEFILISLYNIQDQLEYPFDDEGLDDIKLDIFKINR